MTVAELKENLKSFGKEYGFENVAEVKDGTDKSINISFEKMNGEKAEYVWINE